MERHRLTDEQWELIAGMFEPPKSSGRPLRDRRQLVDGILWILHTGAPWRDLPDRFGPWQTGWYWFDRWNGDGTLEAILAQLRAADLIDDELWCVDGTIVRAAKCAAGGGKRGIPKNHRTTRWAGLAAV